MIKHLHNLRDRFNSRDHSGQETSIIEKRDQFISQILRISSQEGVANAIDHYHILVNEGQAEASIGQVRTALMNIPLRGVKDLDAMAGSIELTSGSRVEQLVKFSKEILVNSVGADSYSPINSWAEGMFNAYPDEMAEAILDGTWSAPWISAGNTLPSVSQRVNMARLFSPRIQTVVNQCWYKAVDKLFLEEVIDERNSRFNHWNTEIPLMGLTVVFSRLSESMEMENPGEAGRVKLQNLVKHCPFFTALTDYNVDLEVLKTALRRWELEHIAQANMVQGNTEQTPSKKPKM